MVESLLAAIALQEHFWNVRLGKSDMEWRPANMTIKGKKGIRQKYSFEDLSRGTTSKILVGLGDKKYKVNAIWDTGATFTVISTDLLNMLGNPEPSGKVKTATSGGEFIGAKYSVEVLIGDTTFFVDACSNPNLNGMADILIGLDIIADGKFTFERTSENEFTMEFIPSSL